MKIIQKLSDMIEEEISDAMKYARCYQAHREDDPELARTFSQLSLEELTHVERLHAQVVRLIKDYRDTHGEPPSHMQAIYNYLHERNIDKVSKVRLMLS